MLTSRLAVLPVLVLIACDNPAAPASRQLRIPEPRADVGVVRTKTNVVFDTDASAENTCNGDFVTLQGKGHQVFTTVATGDTLFITVHSNYADLKGYGVPSGTRYHFNNTQTERAVVVQGTEFTFVDTIRVDDELASDGSEPNLIMRLTQTVSIIDNEVTVTVTKYSLECRGS
jgi:uncharacterized protein YaiE (UPF0345 family)